MAWAGFPMPQVTYPYSTPPPPAHAFARPFPAPLPHSMAMGTHRPETGTAQPVHDHAADATSAPSQPSTVTSVNYPSQTLTTSGYSQNMYDSVAQRPDTTGHRQGGSATNMGPLTPPEQLAAQKQRTSPKRKFREFKEASPPLEQEAATQV